MLRPAPHPRAVLLITSAAAFLVSLDLFIVNIAFPDIRADFPDTDLGQMSWILNGYTVVCAAFLALAGRLGDRSGHKRVFLTGLAPPRVFPNARPSAVARPGCARSCTPCRRAHRKRSATTSKAPTST